MGKAGRWFRSFFVTGSKGRKAKDRADKQADADSQSVLPTPSARKKRRWSFRRPAAAAASKVDQGFSEAEVRVVVVKERHDVAGAVPEDAEEAAAAIKIQSAFRSFLARKAVCALRGMVRLQATVRGQMVRRQATLTLRRIQALVDAQTRARDERLRLLLDDARSRKPLLELVERRSSEETVKVIARQSCYSTPPAKTDRLYQKVSPTTAVSARTLSGRFVDDASLASASECRVPSYMANTESSRAKARSQSAPRQRFSLSAFMAASPSPSGARRRASLDPLDLLGARAAAHWSCSGRVERCASRARERAGAGASLPSSECGSSAWRD